MSSYDFNRQHSFGKDAEQFIYQAFQTRFNVIPAPGYLQQAGVDFTFTDRLTSTVFKVELKTDTRAHRTGNAFIETVSIDREGQQPRPGWAFTSEADFLLYFVPYSMPRRIYRVALSDLREQISRWQADYEERRIPNTDAARGNFNTVGILVPLDKLSAIAQEVIEL